MMIKLKSTLNVTPSYINNFFTHISFGGCPHGVYGAIPDEIVHTTLLGLLEYIVDGMG